MLCNVNYAVPAEPAKHPDRAEPVKQRAILRRRAHRGQRLGWVAAVVGWLVEGGDAGSSMIMTTSFA